MKGSGSKFVLAADAPWRGQVYRTKSGHARLEFDGIEGFMSTVVAVTGWAAFVPVARNS